MSELNKLVEWMREEQNSRGPANGAGMAYGKCADALEAALASEPRVSEEQMRECYYDSIPTDGTTQALIPDFKRLARSVNALLSLQEALAHAMNDTMRPAPTPDGCICSEAYGVGPEQCGKHDVPPEPAPTHRCGVPECPVEHFGPKPAEPAATPDFPYPEQSGYVAEPAPKALCEVHDLHEAGRCTCEPTQEELTAWSHPDFVKWYNEFAHWDSKEECYRAWLAAKPTESTPQGGVDELERLAAEFHWVYQREAKRQGDVRHKDNYADLPENVKQFDRVLAKFVLERDQRIRKEAEAKARLGGKIEAVLAVISRLPGITPVQSKVLRKYDAELRTKFVALEKEVAK